MARKKPLAVQEYEILDNGVIIMREETSLYEVSAGVGKTFSEENAHTHWEYTIAEART